VAKGSHELARLVGFIKARGHTLFVPVSAWYMDDETPETGMHVYSVNMLALAWAEALIILDNGMASRGAWIEAGLCINSNKPICVFQTEAVETYSLMLTDMNAVNNFEDLGAWLDELQETTGNREVGEGET